MDMLSVDSLPVAEEEVVESSSNKLGDVYTFLAKGSFPQSMSVLRRKNLKRYARKFTIDEGKLYYMGLKREEKREVVIEAEQKRHIFLHCHFNDIGHHLGQKKTVQRIQSKYYWLGIIKDVVDWIKLCETCQHAEKNKSLARTVRPIKVDAPWDIVGIDIIGPFLKSHLGNTSVVILIDYFSKWPEVFPVQRTDAVSVARCISKCTHRFGAVKTLVCTQSKEFCDEVTHVLCDRFSSTLKVSALEQLNPLHDCTRALLKEAIAEMVSKKQADWDDGLDPLLFLFRTSINPTTKFSPYFLMFNRTASTLAENCDGLLSYDDREEYSTKEKVSACVTVMEQQQNTVKQLVRANMNAAYKQEKKKNAKRRMCKVTDSMYSAGASPCPKKLKESLYLSFPAETVLAREQNSSKDTKTELTYHLTDSDVHSG
ncbi:gypsy retrotransposon integrase-like protein 1 isoform 1-T1 [Synchiropus picturatus]